MLNLVQIQDKLREMPTQAIMAYANGQNPIVPPYLALGELNRRKQMEQSAVAEQAKTQGEPPTIKQATEEQLGLMNLQKQRAMQGQQRMGQSMANAPAPVPAGVGEEPVQMAGGGLARLPIRNIHRSAYAGGGIVAFANNEDQPVSLNMLSTSEEEAISEATDPEYARKKRQSDAWKRIADSGKPYSVEEFRETVIDPLKAFFTSPWDKASAAADEKAAIVKLMKEKNLSASDAAELYRRGAPLPSASETESFTGSGNYIADKEPQKTKLNREKPANEQNAGITSVIPKKPPVDVTADNVAKFEKMLADRKLDVMPETNKGLEALRKQTEMYEKPVYSDWTEGLLGTVQDIRSGQAVGSSRLKQEKENKQLLADLNLKIAQAEDLKAKSDYEFKRGNFDKAVDYDRQAQKLVNETMTAKAHMITAGKPNQLESWVALYKKDPEAALKYLGQSKAGTFTMEDALKTVITDPMNTGLSDEKKVEKARQIFNLMTQMQTGAGSTVKLSKDQQALLDKYK